MLHFCFSLFISGLCHFQAYWNCVAVHSNFTLLFLKYLWRSRFKWCHVCVSPFAKCQEGFPLVLICLWCTGVISSGDDYCKNTYGTLMGTPNMLKGPQDAKMHLKSDSWPLLHFILFTHTLFPLFSLTFSTLYWLTNWPKGLKNNKIIIIPFRLNIRVPLALLGFQWYWTAVWKWLLEKANLPSVPATDNLPLAQFEDWTADIYIYF